MAHGVKGGMEHPIFGWGQDNFSYIFQSRYNPAMYAQEQWFDRAHNVFLDWFVNAGFVGLAVYLALYVLFILRVWRSSLSVAEKSTLTGLLAGYFIHNMFVFDNLASYILFFFMLGYVGSLKSGVQIKSPADAAPNAGVLGPDVVKYALLPTVIIVLLVTVYYFNERPMIVGADLITAMASCQGNNPDVALFSSMLDANVKWAIRR